MEKIPSNRLSTNNLLEETKQKTVYQYQLLKDQQTDAVVCPEGKHGVALAPCLKYEIGTPGYSALYL